MKGALIRLFYLFSCLTNYNYLKPIRLQEIEAELNEVLALLEIQLPLFFNTISFHFLHHIVRFIRDHGPAWNIWNFAGERQLGRWKRMLRSSKSPEEGICRASFLADKVAINRYRPKSTVVFSKQQQKGVHLSLTHLQSIEMFLNNNIIQEEDISFPRFVIYHERRVSSNFAHAGVYIKSKQKIAWCLLVLKIYDNMPLLYVSRIQLVAPHPETSIKRALLPTAKYSDHPVEGERYFVHLHDIDFNYYSFV